MGFSLQCIRLFSNSTCQRTCSNANIVVAQKKQQAWIIIAKRNLHFVHLFFLISFFTKFDNGIYCTVSIFLRVNTHELLPQSRKKNLEVNFNLLVVQFFFFFQLRRNICAISRPKRISANQRNPGSNITSKPNLTTSYCRIISTKLFQVTHPFVNNFTYFPNTYMN